MKKLEVGDVFLKNGIKYVLISRFFEEWYNTGGMGEHHYQYVLLEDMIKVGNCDSVRSLGVYIHKAKSTAFKENEVSVVEDEAPFEFKEEKVTLYSIRRKKPVKKVIYE